MTDSTEYELPEDPCMRRVWKYVTTNPGLNYRWWTAADDRPHLDPLLWSGPADPVTGFPLPTADAPDFSGIVNSSSVTDGATVGTGQRYGIVDGWIQLPEGTTHWREENENFGELGMILHANCCGGDLVELPGGNHTVDTSGTDRGLIDVQPITPGWHYIFVPMSDLSAFGGIDIMYSINDGQTWRRASVMQPVLPVIEGQDIDCTLPVPVDWSADPLRECCQPVYKEAASAPTVINDNVLIYESSDVSINRTTGFQPKVVANVPAMTAGRYRIIVDYGWNRDTTATDFESRLLIDGVAQSSFASGLLHKQEPQDSGGNVSGTGTDQAYGFSRRLHVDFAEGATPNIQLQYRSSQNNQDASIWDASITIERVG